MCYSSILCQVQVKNTDSIGLVHSFMPLPKRLVHIREKKGQHLKLLKLLKLLLYVLVVVVAQHVNTRSRN